MNKILIVGGSGFIGSYLLPELKADNLDLKEGQDVRDGIIGKYKTIVFLACNQADTPEAYKENIEMYIALEDYRKRFPKTYLVYISSAAVYYSGGAYTQSKRIGEMYAKRFKKYAILRLSNVYGNGDGHGAPDKFMRGETTIHGYGTQVRDLVPVWVVSDKILSFIKYSSYGTFNISSGFPTTVNDMFKVWGKGKAKYIKHNLGVEYSVLEPGRVG